MKDVSVIIFSYCLHVEMTVERKLLTKFALNIS